MLQRDDVRPELRSAPAWKQWTAGGLLCVLLGVAALLVWLRDRSSLVGFSPRAMENWHVYGGEWRLQDGVYTDAAGGRGDKSLAGSERLGEYTVSSDIRFDSAPADTEFGDAGLVLRANNPSVGVNAFRGYYGGVRIVDHALLIGSADHMFQELATTPFPRPIRPGVWYHIQFSAHACTFRLRLEAPDPRVAADLSYVQPGCSPRAGQVGVRTYYEQSSWRNFKQSR